MRRGAGAEVCWDSALYPKLVVFFYSHIYCSAAAGVDLVGPLELKQLLGVLSSTQFNRYGTSGP